LVEQLLHPLHHLQLSLNHLLSLQPTVLAGSSLLLLLLALQIQRLGEVEVGDLLLVQEVVVDRLKEEVVVVDLQKVEEVLLGVVDLQMVVAEVDPQMGEGDLQRVEVEAVDHPMEVLEVVDLMRGVGAL